MIGTIDVDDSSYERSSTGDSGTGNYFRTIDVDASSYERTSTGSGAEMPSDSGSKPRGT